MPADLTGVNARGLISSSLLSFALTIILIIIIIAVKCTFRDFLQSPHGITNCLQCVRSSGQDAIVCKSSATN